MATEHASYLSDPTIQYLPRVLQEIREGLLAFPRFQRPFVWTQDKRRELFRSVLHGLPIGTFMTWRSNLELPTFERLGELALPRLAASSTGRQYVLDGLQRLTTLYTELVAPSGKGLRRPEDDERVDSEEYHSIAVDLSVDLSELALFDVDEEADERLERSLVLRDALDSRRFLKRLQDLGGLSDGDVLMARAESIATRLREYKVPLVPYVSDSLQEVTRAFQLVNSQGTSMSTIHMVNALSWRDDYRLLDELARCRESLAEQRWNALDEMVLFRCFAVAVGEGAYEFDVKSLATRLVEQRNAGERVAAGLRQVAKVLRDRCGIITPDLVPYSLQIIVLFAAFSGRKRLTKKQKGFAEAWLWFTTYLEAFGGSTSAAMIERVTDELKEALEGGCFEWRHRGKHDRRRFPQTFDFRHARSRALALLLARQQRERDVRPDPFKLLAEHGANGVLNALPSTVAGSWRGRPGTRFLVEPERLQELRQQLLDGDASALDGHVVTKDALHAYSAGDYEAFVEQRTQQLERLEKQHFEQVRQALGLVGT